jgi:acyl-CoA thioester hydrolase
MTRDNALTNAFRTDIQVRFADTDAYGHLNNTAFALYAEQARVEFLYALGAERGSLILAHIALDFRKQVRFGEQVYVLTFVEKVGNTSVTLRQHIYADGQCAAEVRSVVVVFDYQTQQPRRVSEPLREKLHIYHRDEGSAQNL